MNGWTESVITACGSRGERDQTVRAERVPLSSTRRGGSVARFGDGGGRTPGGRSLRAGAGRSSEDSRPNGDPGATVPTEPDLGASRATS